MSTREDLIKFFRKNKQHFSFSWHPCYSVGGIFHEPCSGKTGPTGVGVGPTGNPYCEGTTDSDLWLAKQKAQEEYEALSDEEKVNKHIDEVQCIRLSVILESNDIEVFTEFRKLFANFIDNDGFEVRNLRTKPVEEKVYVERSDEIKKDLEEANEEISQLTTDITEKLEAIKCVYDKFFNKTFNRSGDYTILGMMDAYVERLGLSSPSYPVPIQLGLPEKNKSPAHIEVPAHTRVPEGEGRVEEDGWPCNVIPSRSDKYRIREGLFLYKVVPKYSGQLCTIYFKRDKLMYNYLRGSNILFSSIKIKDFKF